MDPSQVTSGADLPCEIHVMVAIPLRGDLVRYETDKKTGAIRKCP